MSIKELVKRIYSKIFLRTFNNSYQEDMDRANPKSLNIHDYIINNYNSQASVPEYENEEVQEIASTTIKPIAFYLPQFHPFDENDRFWGKGFTEWHNVTRAVPLFKGHYQPKLPGELGYYDLRLKEVFSRQIEMAKNHGIFGFCFHHYFLNNKPVMRTPMNLFLSNPDLKMPFCLHWANEPWTVRWDGEREKGGILLNQTHDDAENLGFIKDAINIFKDERYITVDGKPVLLIYRPALFPNFKKTAAIWRKYCLKNGLNGLYIVMVQTFFDEAKDPKNYDCDASVEFPPHQGFCVPKKLKESFFIDNFEGEIIDYQKLAAFSMRKKAPNYTLFRGIMPGWDNTARTKAAKIYHGSSPEVYQKWLNKLVKYTEENLPEDRQLLFINAWNEWAEGAYLEPDRNFGYAYLNATSRAISNLGR